MTDYKIHAGSEPDPNPEPIRERITLITSSTELEQRDARTLVNIQTGEKLDLATASTDQIAEAVWELREAQRRYREWVNQAGEELLRRMDADAKWSGQWGQFEVKGASPAPTREADIEPLRRELGALVEERALTQESAERALEPVIPDPAYKPNWSAINALLKVPGVAERISKHIREVPKTRRAPSVNLARSAPPK